MDRRSFLRASASLTLIGSAGCLNYIPGYSPDTPSERSTERESPSATTTSTTATMQSSTTTSAPGTIPPTTASTTPAERTTSTVTTATSTATTTTTQEAIPSKVTVEVGKNGLFFVPDRFEVAKGGTVEWVWVGNGHNVLSDDQPEGSAWTGTPGGRDRTYDSGYTYTHTFDLPGEYLFYCSVHRQYGMEGTFTVR